MAVTAAQRRRTPVASVAGLPCGRRVPRGSVRWYLLKVPEGGEQGICDRLLRIVPRDVLRDCFVVRREGWRRKGGTWTLQLSVAHEGYVFAVTDDPLALSKALAQLSLPVEVAGADGRAWMPLSKDVQAWYERCMDERHVLRNSVAEIADDVIRVTDGPLLGHEASIRRVDRHHRRCMVSIADANGDFTELMPLVVPVKTVGGG